MLATVDQAVGANLRRLRESAGLSQADLAARLTVLGTDWTASNVSLIEAGKRKLTLTALADLCRILGVPATAMFGTHDAEGGSADRLAALGGTPTATTAAHLDVADDEAAAEVARRRLGDRVLNRIVAAFTWIEDPFDPESHREHVMAALESEYQRGRDVLRLRDELAEQRLGHDEEPTLQSMANARGWATRDMIDTIWDALASEGVVEPRPPEPFEMPF